MSIVDLLQELKAKDLEQRAGAALALRELTRDGLGAPQLVEALQSNHGRVCREAAKNLGLMGQTDPSIIDALCQMLDARSDKLKRTAANALVHLGQPAVEPLVAALDGATEHSRYFIIGALGQLRSRTAQEPLMAIFWESKDKVARAAARALAQIDFQATLHSLTLAARQPYWSHEGIKSRNGLVQLGIMAVNPIEIIEATVMGGDALTAFEISQGKGNQHVLLGAIRGLGQRREAGGISVLLDALEYDSFDVRAEAMIALRRIKGPVVVQGALQILQNPQLSDGSRRSAAQLLGQMRAQEALAPMATCLLDPSAHIMLRSDIARTYTRFGDPAHISLLFQALAALALEEDPNAMWVTGTLHDSLAQLIPKASEELAFALLRDALSHAPSANVWGGVFALLRHWPEHHNRSLAISYANQHFQGWKAELERPLLPFPESK